MNLSKIGLWLSPSAYKIISPGKIVWILAWIEIKIKVKANNDDTLAGMYFFCIVATFIPTLIMHQRKPWIVNNFKQNQNIKWICNTFFFWKTRATGSFTPRFWFYILQNVRCGYSIPGKFLYFKDVKTLLNRISKIPSLTSLLGRHRRFLGDHIVV